MDYDRYVRNGEGAVLLQLGKGGAKIHAKVNRSANAYGTARIMGGIALRNWFFKNFKPMDNVNVDLSSTEIIVLEGSRTLGAAMDGASAKSPRPIARPVRPKGSEEKSDEPLPPELQPAMPVEVPSLDVTKDILEFTRRLTSGEIEIYNEFSLQHELGKH